jgi:hypothetical protein
MTSHGSPGPTTNEVLYTTALVVVVVLFSLCLDSLTFYFAKRGSPKSGTHMRPQWTGILNLRLSSTQAKDITTTHHPQTTPHFNLLNPFNHTLQETSSFFKMTTEVSPHLPVLQHSHVSRDEMLFEAILA